VDARPAQIRLTTQQVYKFRERWLFNRGCWQRHPLKFGTPTELVIFHLYVATIETKNSHHNQNSIGGKGPDGAIEFRLALSQNSTDA
jgi:hypothetical protein